MDGGGKLAERLRKALPKSMLSRLKNGQRGPSVPTALTIERITDGLIPVAAWVQEYDEGSS